MLKIKSFVSKQIFDIKTYGLRRLIGKFFTLVKILFRIPIYLIAVVPCIIIRLISPWILIRINRFPCGNFGDFVEFPSLYHCKKELKLDLPKKKYLDFVYIDTNDKIHNKQLAKMWRRKFNFLPGYLLGPIDRVNRFMPGWKVHEIAVLSRRRSRDVNNLSERHQPLHFTNEEEIYGKEMLNKFGLTEGDKFVCLAIRDSGYQKKKISPEYRDWSYHDYRNQDVNNYLLAAEELAERGYYIFRMGVSVEKPFTSNNPKIIDYANTSLRSDFMDVYLGAKCSFCISTSFGFDELPDFFGRPIAFSSVAPLGDLHTYRKKDLYLTKHHILRKEKRRLSLSEIFSHGVAFAYESRIYDDRGIELVENTSEEIKDLVIEMANYLEFNNQWNTEDEELQQSFKNLYTKNLKRFNQKPENQNELWHVQEVSHHMDARILHGKVRCRYSSKFLKENKNWLR